MCLGVEEALTPQPPDIIGNMAKLQNAIRNAFEGLRRDYPYPFPQFHGKKGEKPEDHWLKVEEWLAYFHVVEDD